MNHFDIFRSLFTKENVTEEQINKYYSPFLANRQLMSDDDFVFLVNNLNILNLSKLDHYNVLRSSLPKLNKPPYLRFIKQQKEDDPIIKMIAEYYNISYSIAFQYNIFVENNKKLYEEIEYKWYEKRGDLKSYFKKHKKKR